MEAIARVIGGIAPRTLKMAGVRERQEEIAIDV